MEKVTPFAIGQKAPQATFCNEAIEMRFDESAV
jgi:hypothetical protein